ncbi:GNAT family N-acetyltransferase [Anaerostipes caccae]|uniref:GNAT family N-acetyltransferase n=1 Tax=Anaerostipes caccae TaxID=105841 RepID=UPI0038D36354
MKDLLIRRYKPSDCEDSAKLFYNTIHAVNAKDYTGEQLNVWASGSENLEKWNRSLIKNTAFVAILNELMVGFGDIDETGYFDRLFVHKDHQREGIVSVLCEKLEQTVQEGIITVHASITAKPFFEKRGYEVVQVQRAERRGMYLTNYLMSYSRHDR